MKDNKSLWTNVLSVLCIGLGFVVPKHGHLVQTVGFFALSGALTNWLAIYMLFEKIPYLYGSGVIVEQFETFKEGIRKLIMGQFFNPTQIERFFNSEHSVEQNNRMVERLVAAVDYDKVFTSFTDAVVQSQIGSFLKLAGGASALNFLKEPVTLRLKTLIHDVADENLSKLLNSPDTLESVTQRIQTIVESRLAELSPQQVKRLVEDMIAAHLGWLVVWGGILGGALGLIMELIKLKFPF